MGHFGRHGGGRGYLDVARRQRPNAFRRLGRRALLAGTALATSLIITSLAPTPGEAAEQIQTPVELITLNDIRIILNSSKRFTTLGTTINSLDVAATAIAASNLSATSGVVALEDLTQVIDGTQTIDFNNFISIINSGDIDPLIGINGQINNLGIVFGDNAAAISNISGEAAVLALGDLSQYLFLSQSSYVTNTIRERNSGDITATLFGMFAEINNLEIASFANAAAADNINGQAFAVSATQHIQLIDLQQINQLSNNIRIVNSGEIDPRVGIFAGINNSFTAAFANAIAAVNVNGQAAVVDADDLTQVIEFDQANVLGNAIAIDNTGAIDASRVGIWGTINNFDILGLANTADSDNINGAASVISFGDHRQSLFQRQTNSISNEISIDNQGSVDADIGILATITNEDVAGLSNDLESFNTSGSAVAFDFDDRIQEFDGTQTNLIDNDIYVTNNAEIDADDTGISAGIGNLDIDDWENLAENANINAEAAVTADDLTQSSTINQANILENDIVIVNQAKVTAGDTGIEALIENRNLEFANSLNSENTHAVTSDVDDDVIQTTDATQNNLITNNINIANSGEVRGGNIGIAAEIINQAIEMTNVAEIDSSSDGSVGDDLTQTVNVSQSNRIESEIKIVNTGKVTGGDLGIYASIPEPELATLNDATQIFMDTGTPNVSQSDEVDSSIVIDNAGYIGADSLFAVDTVGASTTIYNRSGGVIEGYVDLTDENDEFFNQAGGTFQARKQSDFGGGSDLFQNMGTVQTAQKLAKETTSFVNLERFENAGLVSLADGRVGDTFTISNTVGGTDLEYVASEGARLGVDAFLGGPGSTADNFVIEGNASGRTLLQVLNTNPGGGAYNPQGIPVAFVDGDVQANAFYLDRPIDAGFFDYDLFFVPTGSGFFELRSHPGGGSHVLPRLITASHDVFHSTTETWLDRTADLRVLLNRAAPLPPAALTETGEPVPTSFVPAVWVKGQGTWLSQEDKGKSTSFGRTYHYDLERDLTVMNFETGIDMGVGDVLAPGDMLVFGVLGGAVFSDLRYDNLARQFDINGGEAGAYATYLRGGLFVDTLLKAHFLEIDTEARGFPSVDTTTWGIRTDAGYRFGSFTRGPFVEPLATIAFAQNDIDDFRVDGNFVAFDTETNVRGRLGLRLGTSYEPWEGTLFEPFIIGSLWSNLSGENNVTLTSSGRTFRFEDEADDLWGVISGGVNFFNPGAQTAVFAKVDYIFGDETQGVSAKGGMRYNW